MTLLQPAHAFHDEAASPAASIGGFEELMPSAESRHRLRLSRALARSIEIERSVEEQRVRLAELEAILYVDPLTGLYNRRALLAELRREIAGVGIQGPTTGIVLVLDLDDLHLMKARMGAAAGDALLRRSAQALCAAVRTGDVVARLGGDEFCVLLTRSDRPAGLRRAQELMRRFEESTFVLDDVTIPLRATFGWCGYGPGDSAEAIVTAADMEMIKAKRGD